MNEQIVSLLSEKGLRKTPQRLQILETLDLASKPLSAEEVQKLLRGYSCDLATIYRNLQSLEREGVLEKTFFSDEVARYRLRGLGHRAHAHHIECRKCHKVEVIDDCLLGAQVKAFQRRGFREISHRLEFLALCPDCA